MNTNITNTTNQTLFTATVKDGEPQRLSVVFHPDSKFNSDKIDLLISQPPVGNRIRINLVTKAVDDIGPGDLASPLACGTLLTFRKVTNDTYEREDDLNGTNRIGNLSQVTLQVKDAKVLAKFEAGVATALQPTQPSRPPAQPVGLDIDAILRMATTAPKPTQPSGPRKKSLPPIPYENRLKGNLKDNNGNFKEDCGLNGIIEQKNYIKHYSNQEKYYHKEKDIHRALRAKEKAFEDLDKRKTEAANHTKVDGRLTARAMIEHLQDGDITPYLQVIRLITSNSQNIQDWLAEDPSNTDKHRRFLEAEKAYILKGNGNQ